MLPDEGLVTRPSSCLHFPKLHADRVYNGEVKAVTSSVIGRHHSVHYALLADWRAEVVGQGNFISIAHFSNKAIKNALHKTLKSSLKIARK